MSAEQYAFVGGSLTSGGTFKAAFADAVLAVRVTDQACVVHPKWMTREQTVDLCESLGQLLVGWDEDRP
jgi:hypothetical protein